jgi:plasmid stability protein
VSSVPALHVRNVPDDVVAALRHLARVNRRSLNAELVHHLEFAARGHRERGVLTRRLAEIAARVNLPPDAPTPEEVIRRGRDSR